MNKQRIGLEQASYIMEILAVIAGIVTLQPVLDEEKQEELNIQVLRDNSPPTSVRGRANRVCRRKIS